MDAADDAHRSGRLAFRNEADNTAFPPVFIPHPPTLVVVSFGATALALLLGVPAGDGIAKAKVAALILIARATPGLSCLVPPFLLFQWLGLTGTLAPLVITHLVIGVPIVAWIMIGFFEGSPNELAAVALVATAAALLLTC